MIDTNMPPEFIEYVEKYNITRICKHCGQEKLLIEFHVIGQLFERFCRACRDERGQGSRARELEKEARFEKIKDRKVYVYALCDPDNGDVHYIGSSVNPRVRLTGHLYAASSCLEQKEEWIMQLRAEKRNPELRILEQTTEEHRKTVEQKWYDHFHRRGDDLYQRPRT